MKRQEGLSACKQAGAYCISNDKACEFKCKIRISPKHVQIPDTPVSHSFFGSEDIAFVKKTTIFDFVSPLRI